MCRISSKFSDDFLVQIRHEPQRRHYVPNIRKSVGMISASFLFGPMSRPMLMYFASGNAVLMARRNVESRVQIETASALLPIFLPVCTLGGLTTFLHGFSACCPL